MLRSIAITKPIVTEAKIKIRRMMIHCALALRNPTGAIVLELFEYVPVGYDLDGS